MMQPTNESLSGSAHPGYKKVVVISGALLLIIIAGIVAWYFLRGTKTQRPLDVDEQTQIINQLDAEAKKHPVEAADRYQLVTGRPLPTSATGSKPVSKPIPRNR